MLKPRYCRRKSNKKELRDVTLAPHHDEHFFVCRGDRIGTIYDLANCIEHLSKEQFAHHVNDTKNDFAAWIFHVLKNPFLARDLDAATNKTNQAQYVSTIRDHIAWLEA